MFNSLAVHYTVFVDFPETLGLSDAGATKRFSSAMVRAPVRIIGLSGIASSYFFVLGNVGQFEGYNNIRCEAKLTTCEQGNWTPAGR